MKHIAAKLALLLFCSLILILAGLVLSYTGFLHLHGTTRYWDHTHFLRDQKKEIDGTEYYFDEEGRLYEGWYADTEGRKYLISGTITTGSHKINKKEYYFDENGLMQTGIVSTDSGTFYYDEDGVKKSGWIDLSEDTYYFGRKGMQTGWFNYDKARYYFENDGKMARGRTKIEKQLYIFREDGKMLSNGWYEDTAGTFYLEEDGHAVSGPYIIDGNTYLFSHSCKLQRNSWVGNSYAGADGIMQRDKNIDGLRVDAQGEKIYDGSYGDGGSLYIPSVGISIPVWKTPGGEEGQKITDDVNSAACLTSFAMPVIADHKDQGFESIKSCIPGETIAFLLTADTVKEYVCSDLFIGNNIETDLLDDEGNSIDESGADLCLYTCNEDWKHVTIVYFNRR